ncbi:Hypothetical protein PBC10988_11700 [Planctomycetales bacterium 10988]|nr:Hypothetical protein PBC10988_11700 [Planctomycetales bacterium 10988]
MKLNFKKFDPKQFFLYHGEKIALGVFGLCGVYLAYGLLSADVYERSPRDLTNEANQLDQQVQNASWQTYLQENQPQGQSDPFSNPEAEYGLYGNGSGAIGPDGQPVVDFSIKDFYETAMGGNRVANLSRYAIVPWSPVLVKPDTERGMPELFGLSDLKAHFGFGALVVQKEDAVEVVEVETETETDRRRLWMEAQNKPAQPDNSGDYYEEDYYEEEYYEEEYYDEEDYGSNRGFGGVTIGSNEKAEGFRWIALTGVVPFGKQQREYFEKLNVNTVNLQAADIVNYIGFKLQRAEVTGKTNVEDQEQLVWVDVELDQLLQTIARFGKERPYLIPDALINPRLCMKRPPSIDSMDPRSIIHPEFEDAILNKEEFLEEQEKKRADAVAAAATPSEDAPKRPKVYGFGTPPQETQYEDDYVDEDDFYYAESQLDQAVLDDKRDMRMFRVFDFEVVPGKTYRYRVALVLRNPNFELGDEFPLKDPESGKEEMLITEWSNMSAPVEIPFNSHLLVGGQAKRASVSKEATINVVVRQWDQEQGVNASKIFPIGQGSVANYPDQEVKMKVPGENDPVDAVIDFETNKLLVDWTGGDRMRQRGRAGEPVTAVFMDEDGKIKIHSQITDGVAYEEESNKIDELNPPEVVQPTNPDDEYYEEEYYEEEYEDFYDDF